MTCQEAEKLVVPYIKDELSPMELEEFIDHIKNCPNCREELEIHYPEKTSAASPTGSPLVSLT